MAAKKKTAKKSGSKTKASVKAIKGRKLAVKGNKTTHKRATAAA